jgi:hypothetical protein
MLPLLAMALPSIIGGVAGLIGAKKAPKQMTQTEAQTQSGSSLQTSGATLDPMARASLSYGLQQARSQLDSPGGGVSPVFGQAQGAIGRGLAGQQNFGGYQARQVNPYADMAYNNAANATQSRLSSEFARSGRNLGAAEAPRSQELQHLAAGIYGPAYEAEAQRQYGAQEGAAQRNYGAYGTALNQSPYFSQTQQGLGLDQYLQRMGGMIGYLPQEQYSSSQSTGTGSGSQTTPVYNNPMAGFLGGAMLGRNLFPGGFGGGQQQGGVLDSSGYRIPGT